MNGKVKVLSGVLATVMALGVFPGCSGKGNGPAKDTKPQTKAEGPEYLNVTGYPITKQPVTFKVMVSKHVSQPDWGEILSWKEYEKISGIKIAWDNVPSGSITEKRNLALASGDLPDMFYRCSISDNDLTKFGGEGVFIKLNDHIDKYAPNLKKLMATMPTVKKGLPCADGNIYSMPSVSSNFPVELNPKLYVSQKWLDRVGMKLPTSTEELYTLLQAFKTRDANGNGKPDEIPWSVQSYNDSLNTLRGAWGLKNRGNGHGNVDLDEKTGKLRFIHTDPANKELLQYVNKLYKEGLIDQEMFTMNSTQLLAKGEQNLVGAFTHTTTQQIGNTYQGDYVGLTEALKGPNGDKLWTGARGNIAGKAAFTVTRSNKYPEAAVRWLDYFYSDEGAKLLYAGVEGVSVKKNADGTYSFLDEIVNNIPKGSTFDQAVAKYTPYAGGGLPALNSDKFFQGGEMQPVAKKAAMDMSKYLPKELWGPFAYTPEENATFTSLENDIISYVNQMVPQFITGKTPFSEWDNFIAQCKKMGLDDYMKIYTAGYERYKKN